MKAWGLIGVACLVLGASNPAGAQTLQGGSGSREYAVPRGRTIPLGQHYTSSNCGFTGTPQVKVLQSPSLGTVSQATVQTVVESSPLDASGKPRPASHMECVGKPMTVLEVRYTAGSKKGTESFSYQLAYPGGHTSRIDAHISIK